ncbi:MAG: YceI family protein [Terracidiphilus sp.]|jgi:polyisoprenoid-binding protein YceI
MKRLALLTGILALAAPMALAQYSTWTSDPVHSEVDFTIRHGGVSNVHGRFGNVTATLVYNVTDVAKSTVTATIDISTVDTGEPHRDGDLKTGNFLDAVKFPTATFTSTSVVKNGNKLTVAGNFTLHGVTKPIVLDVEGPSTPVESSMDHKPHSGFTATTTISRTAYGIGTNVPSALVGDEVKLVIEVEIVKQDTPPAS